MAISPTHSSPATELCVSWSVRARSFDGGEVCGDAFSVVAVPNGVHIAVIDGLGHGADAAAAAEVAVDTLANANVPVTDLMKRCHEALHKTRGAVITIASIDAIQNTMTWVGVGNVEGILFRADAAMVPCRESLALRGGVIGYQIPSLRANTMPVLEGDVLVLVTDGIDSCFSQTLLSGRTTDDIATDILENHSKGTDDALVLVARYIGLHA